MKFRRSQAVTMAALVLALPLRGLAQAPALPADVAPVSKPAQQNAGAAPRQYLNEAARVIMTIPEQSNKGEAQKRLAELRRHFAELISAYDKNPNPFVYPAVPGDEDPKIDNKSERPNWKKSFTEVENDLANILGAGAAVPAPAPSAAAAPVNAAGTAPPPGSGAVGTTGQVVQTPQATPVPVVDPTTGIVALPGTPVATNTAGVQVPARDPTTGAVAQAGSTPAPSGATGTTTGAPQAPQAGSVNAGFLAGGIGVKNLDPEVRRQLERFRLDVELFFAAMTMNLESEATR